MRTRGETEEIRYTEKPTDDAVDALWDFAQEYCEVEIGREFQTEKARLRSAYEVFCKERGVEPPSNGLFGTLLLKLFPSIWGDTAVLNGEKTPVWRNLVLKRMPEAKTKEAT